jgi:hypothetical protein
MNELNTALYSTLSAGTALLSLLGGTAIYHLQAPDGAALPYLIYSWQGGGPTTEVRYLTSQVEFIRAYGTTALQAGSIMAAADALLDYTPMTVSGWTNIFLAREGDYEMVETLPNGEQVYTDGGFYRIMLDK